MEIKVESISEILEKSDKQLSISSQTEDYNYIIAPSTTENTENTNLQEEKYPENHHSPQTNGHPLVETKRVSIRQFLFVLAMGCSFGALMSQKRANKSLSKQLEDNISTSNRPPLSKRKFTSSAIEQVILDVKSKLTDQTLGLMFEQNFPNTLDTTVEHHSFNEKTNRYDTFIITGDIEAMWQRDSTNQVLPYLPYMKLDIKLDNLIIGLINRQIQNVLLDPYANAYTYSQSDSSPFRSDTTTKITESGRKKSGMTPGIWERKFEIDSLAAVLKLQVLYVEETKNTNPSFMHEDYFASLEVIFKVLTEQQLGTLQEDQLNRIPYTFQRQAHNPTDSTSHGRGNLCTGKNGMVKSFFRPSDDACTFPYFVPGNAMLVTYLAKTADIIESKNPSISKKFRNLSKAIKDDIYARGITQDKDGNKVFAFEIDGFGNAIKMDDANIPSLLSLPYLGFVDSKDPLYVATRKMILDPQQNPYFFSGKSGEGIGGPHIGDQYVWPMSLITRAITSDDDAEIMTCLNTLKNTTAGTLFMHEAFYSEDASIFTRHWFAWANTYFGELILHLLKVKPNLLIESPKATVVLPTEPLVNEKSIVDEDKRLLGAGPVINIQIAQTTEKLEKL